MPSPVDDRREVGRRGEDIAAAHLASLGYDVLARNFRVAAGEVDLVARDGDTTVFVEVRSRRGRAMGSPEESVTPRKQARLVEVALSYLQQNGLESSPWRIDVVSIEFDPGVRVLRVDVVPNAVEWPSGEIRG